MSYYQEGCNVDSFAYDSVLKDHLTNLWQTHLHLHFTWDKFKVLSLQNVPSIRKIFWNVRSLNVWSLRRILRSFRNLTAQRLVFRDGCLYPSPPPICCCWVPTQKTHIHSPKKLTPLSVCKRSEKKSELELRERLGRNIEWKWENPFLSTRVYSSRNLCGVCYSWSC